LTEKDIKDLYEVRIALETAILRHITPKLSKAELRKIETIYQKGKGAIKADDRPKSRFRKRNTFTGLSLRVPPKAGKGACLHAVVPAFAETLRASRRSGTQAWQSQEFLRSAQDKALFHSQ
jgi:hypothetical protein